MIMTKSKRNLFFPFLCLVLCLLFPAVCSKGVRQGLRLSLDAALPSLFPSLVLSSLFTKQTQKAGTRCFFIPFLLGLLCGFPVGAASVSALVREGEISKKDGEKLLFFCNNASPAFLISFCGQVVLNDIKKGFFLFLMQSTLSSLCLLFFFGKRIFSKKKTTRTAERHRSYVWELLPSALKDATSSFLYIMSCVIFFSFLTELIRHLFSLKAFSSALLGLFTELCGGLSRLSELDAPLIFPLCALGCGWGGISVHLQTAGMLEGSGLSLKNHLFGKLFFSGTLFALALFFQKHL